MAKFLKSVKSFFNVSEGGGKGVDLEVLIRFLVMKPFEVENSPRILAKVQRVLSNFMRI